MAHIAASIREFGWTNPILIDAGNGIIAGHARLLKAHKPAHNFRRGWVREEAPDRYGWNVVAPGPGHGIQLASGRLLSTIWMSPHYRRRPSAAAAIYSDDHGKTWQSGALLERNLVNPSEHVAIELADGRVMTNMRSEGTEHRRANAISPDGISNWTRPELHPEFVQEYNMKSRDELRVRLSYDEGKTWPVAKLMQEGARLQRHGGGAGRAAVHLVRARAGGPGEGQET